MGLFDRLGRWSGMFWKGKGKGQEKGIGSLLSLLERWSERRIGLV